MEDIYKMMMSQDFDDFFLDYRNEVEEIRDLRTKNLSMEDAYMYYGISDKDNHHMFKVRRKLVAKD
jgi:hypothetical protein